MASSVRVLPVLIAVGIGALAFKSIDIYQAVAQAVGEGQAPAPETALTEGVGDHAADVAPATPGAEPAPPAAEKAGECLPSVDYAAELGITAGEINVLRSLQSRREELDKRDTDLSTREQAAAAAESRLEDQIDELKSVETKVQGMLTAMDAKRDERMTSLIKTYEAMKPKDAAKIFDGMEMGLLVDLAKGMKSASLAAAMSLMQPKKAEALTRSLADLAKPPAGLDNLPPSVAPPKPATASVPAAPVTAPPKPTPASTPAAPAATPAKTPA
jgi:flagellar motility protein MotE (MotC chaperone)